MTLSGAVEDITHQLAWAKATSEAARATSAQRQDDVDLLGQTDIVLRALLKQRTDEAFQEVEQLILKGLRTVFGQDEWSDVKLQVEPARGRLAATLLFKYLDFEFAPPLEAFGGGPASVAAFLLRMLVVRRVGLAPLLLLDESI